MHVVEGDEDEVVDELELQLIHFVELDLLRPGMNFPSKEESFYLGQILI